MTQPESDVVAFYLEAHEEVVRAGFEEELVWLEALSDVQVTDRHFLLETAWVILSSGFRFSVVAERFPRVSAAFRDFTDLDWIMESRSECEQRALSEFGHRRKIAAIGSAVRMVWDSGSATFIEGAREDVLSLTAIPFIGHVTARHLARNLGIDVAKPDRHLMRLAHRVQSDVGNLADALAETTGDPVRLVDGVLWRHAVLPSDACGH